MKKVILALVLVSVAAVAYFAGWVVGWEARRPQLPKDVEMWLQHKENLMSLCNNYRESLAADIADSLFDELAAPVVEEGRIEHLFRDQAWQSASDAADIARHRVMEDLDELACLFKTLSRHRQEATVKTETNLLLRQEVATKDKAAERSQKKFEQIRKLLDEE